MPESQEHIDLVRGLRRWAVDTYGLACWGLCALSDLPETTEKPPLIGGFRPDVWVVDIPQTLTVLGEAKTAEDIDNPHSRRQFQAYLAYLAVQPGPALAVSVPWSARPTAVETLELLVSDLKAANVTRYYLSAGSILRFPR